jgi:hypothetical protein
VTASGLKALLRAAMQEALERRAGLPRITINDPPKRWRKARIRYKSVPPEQLRLPLYQRRKTP